MLILNISKDLMHLMFDCPYVCQGVASHFNFLFPVAPCHIYCFPGNLNWTLTFSGRLLIFCHIFILFLRVGAEGGPPRLELEIIHEQIKIF